MPQFSAKSRCVQDEWRITAFKKHMKRAEPGKTPLQQDMNKKHFPNSTTKCPLNQQKTCKAHPKRDSLHPMVDERCFALTCRRGRRFGDSLQQRCGLDKHLHPAY